MPRRFVVCLTVLPALLAGACSASYPAPSAVVPLVALQLQYRTATGDLLVGTGVHLAAFSVDADGVWHDVTAQTSWGSSDPTVVNPATSPQGLHVATGPGIAVITGLYDGRTDSVTVVVRSGPPGYPYLEISPRGDRRAIGTTAVARVLLRHSLIQWEDVTSIAAWRSSDTRIVTVDSGQVTGVATGTAEISVAYNAYTARYGLSIEPRTR
jgi:hypothetical protein